MHVQTPLMSFGTPLIRAWTPLTCNSGISKIDFLKTLSIYLKNFFAHKSSEFVTLTYVLFFQKLKKFKNDVINIVLNF